MLWVWGTYFTILLGSISTAIKDAFLSADVVEFGFDEIDDVEKGLMNWKLIFISATVIDSHGCLKNFLKLVLPQLIGSFHKVLQALGFG